VEVLLLVFCEWGVLPVLGLAGVGDVLGADVNAVRQMRGVWMRRLVRLV
jgi:hypothetical protein